MKASFKRKWMMLCIGACFIFGCARSVWHPPSHETRNPLPSRVNDTSDASVVNQITHLNRKGIQVISMGQNYLMSIPMVFLFPEQSPRLTWGAYDTLNDVTVFLKQFRHIAVHVAAYSIPYRSSVRERALATARTAAVSNYLWSQGIDARLLFAEGNNHHTRISCASKTKETVFNARIEISFRNAVA